MIKSITVIFDDNTQVTLTGDADRVAQLIRGGSYKGFIMHNETYYPSENGWDIDVLKKLLKEKK